MPAVDNSPPRTFKSLALTFGFWTLLGLSYALSAGLSASSEGEVANWGRLLTWYLAGYWLWMLLAPIIARLGDRTATASWRGFCAVQIPASVLMSLAQLVVHVGIYWAFWHASITTADSFGGYLKREFVFNFYFAQLTYWVIHAVQRGMASRRHLRDERWRNAQLETQLAQSQLQALRMQLQPHFLFNTLNAISALTLADPMQARQMIARLGDLLRLTLEERHAQTVSLARELELVRAYLDIQRIRFRDRLAIHIDASAESLGATLPGMILQPLVENALQHGLSQQMRGGNLWLVARREGRQLHLRVEDDGAGLPPGGGNDGVGLGNTRARLAMLFGADAQLTLCPRVGGGTLVQLHLPFRLPADPVAT
ncbi:MAG TPA: histidine kinase [Rhodanobacteraceae bacterium]|nr:histidine kinase [Rhodanobacteraceae bacterium]